MDLIENRIEGKELSRDIIEISGEDIGLFLFHNIRYEIQGIQRKWTASVIGTSRDEALVLLRQKANNKNITIKDYGNQFRIDGFSNEVIIYLVNKYQKVVSQALERDKKMNEKMRDTKTRPMMGKKEKNKSAWRLF